MYLCIHLFCKGRVNSNLQDFRHECQVLGGRSKCHICEDIECLSETGTCALQLQGVNTSDISENIPTVSDHAWAVGGSYRSDYGGENVTHFCVFTSTGNCTLPTNEDFSDCTIRCFGYGFEKPPVKLVAPYRSITDVYPGMGRWVDDGTVDLWTYPKNCEELELFQNASCAYSGITSQIPSFNPQGYTFTFAGDGVEGFRDGSAETARFNGPEDVAVDEYGRVFVADTGNHAIRMIAPDGTVTTIAGKGKQQQGYRDGFCADATFTFPKGLDVRNYHSEDEGDTTVIIVADTGNHRIRRIDLSANGICRVRCWTGLCGNNTLSAAELEFQASPLTGYADGSGDEARFSAPESVAFMDGDYFAVADTGNFLLRLVVASNGSTYTLAGHVINGPTDPNGNPLAGCTPPCLAGQQGFRDGNLTYAEFYNPLDITRGPNNTLWIADEQRIRILEMPEVVTTYYGIQSTARVSTIAGTSLQGHDDGLAQESNFFYSSGLFITSDDIAYVADSATCRIRRITPYPSVAEHIQCGTRPVELIRPSGCTSYDQPIDKIGRKVSRVEKNVQYNFGWPNEGDLDKGKYIKNCVGVPPRDLLDKRFVNITGDNLVVDDLRTAINEDSEQGVAILVNCPSTCTADLVSNGNVRLEGTTWYSEQSSICLAAMHDGKISSAGGLVQIILQRLDFLQGDALAPSLIGSTQNGLTSSDIPPGDVFRVFNIEPFNISNNMVHTVAGAPSAPLQLGCGFRDSQPSHTALFDLPSGIAARFNMSLTDSNYLYIADTNNHRIRAISASCTQICENGGRCVGPDICECPPGWEGVDCTKPICSSSCGLNSVCVAPDTCGCKPGFTGESCDIALCLQECRNNGTCTAPDTCTCADGWFDSNCTTPVCSLTCANGGNCTAPGSCACPSEWTGPDCRIPVCEQTCYNGGFCVAPNTCICSPQWTGYDCTIPICSQGYFEPNDGDSESPLFRTNIRAWPMYKNCDLQSWCNATNEFECDQLEMSYGIIRVSSGPEYRAITGRKVSPTQCMNIELPIYYKLPFQLVYSDNTTTGDVRYSPLSPYTSNENNPWRGYLEPTSGHTGPWTYTEDRQVANVNWLNVSQGLYVCANGGKCVAPDVCTCAPGWIGFDCRTPVCTQGYYKDRYETYVSGQQSSLNFTLEENQNITREIDIFEVFMGNNSYRLTWPYSNPDYSIEFEFYERASTVTRQVRDFRGIRYFGVINFTEPNNTFTPELQGGYRCTIRADTQWENEFFVYSHPNYYSRYMDSVVQDDGQVYSDWVNMEWPPIHRKSRVLDQTVFNITYAYTNEGWRRLGIWNRTGNFWEFGICLMEFYRNCSGDVTKQFDIESQRFDVFVQDTDIAFRPRITYNDLRVIDQGRWAEAGGQCVDEVIRGCANNGTCVAPDVCKCAEGWEGFDCRTPICEQECNHHGNCTLPNTCTCERGWAGDECTIPLCAQECQNGGVCVAPDTCQCFQYPNTFRDGRIAGGRPLFQDENGDPLPSGWTGYDCSVPICVQAESFLFNVPSSDHPGYVELGGRGGDDKLECVNNDGVELPRCPQFDEYVTGNDGRTFQTGCGFDPFDTGCCITDGDGRITCYKCAEDRIFVTNNTYFCAVNFESELGQTNEVDKFAALGFTDQYNNYLLCGKYHSPRRFVRTSSPGSSVDLFDYGVELYWVNPLEPTKSSFNFRSNLTSNRFLCNVFEWKQGDYVDDAGLGSISGVGSLYGLQNGRHVRINTPNILFEEDTQTFTRGPVIAGEGIYRCANDGSCIGPDKCTCGDGFDGYDCRTPLCRHLQVTGAVSSCLNGGICKDKDSCDCVQTGSVLWNVHPETRRGKTGWTGTDCSMPVCVQGFYDPFCADLPQAPGGEGCYRCANKGNCTAPDTCTCAEGWTGFDCKTPVCETVADPLTRLQLGTAFEDKVISFESDPCGVEAIYGRRGWRGTKYARGNCTEPNQCTCLCKVPYFRKACHRKGRLCDGPWQDPMVQVRDLVGARGPEYTFGTTHCYYGYEGNVDDFDRFTTCHQTIYKPSEVEEISLILIIVFSIFGFVAIIFYRYASVRLKRRFLLAKIERRRTRRDSEQSGQSGERNSSMEFA